MKSSWEQQENLFRGTNGSPRFGSTFLITSTTATMNGSPTTPWKKALDQNTDLTKALPSSIQSFSHWHSSHNWRRSSHSRRWAISTTRNCRRSDKNLTVCKVGCFTVPFFSALSVQQTTTIGQTQLKKQASIVTDTHPFPGVEPSIVPESINPLQSMSHTIHGRRREKKRTAHN